MRLFLDPESYSIVCPKQQTPIPESKLLNQAYIMLGLKNILCEEEKAKLYEFFNKSTENSKKKIKRVRLYDVESAEIIKPRLVNRLNEKILDNNQKQYVFNRVLPHLEIIQWPANCMIDETFNSITRNMYIPPNDNVRYGTYIIPLVSTTCSTLFREFGMDGIQVIKCECFEKCSHTKCPCKVSCVCGEPVKIRITENNNYFYLSNLEPVEILGETRLNLYVHLEYRLK